MKYIKEIIAFYDLMELESLSASAVNLWHLLLHINNNARWAMEFTVSSNELKLKGSLSESSFQRARKELVARGFVTYRSRGANLAPIYRMKRLYQTDAGGDDVNGGNVGQIEQGVKWEIEPGVNKQAEGQMVGQTNHQMNGQVSPQAEE